MIKIPFILRMKRYHELPPLVWFVNKEFANVYKFRASFVMTAITGGIVCFKPNIHRLLGLQNRCPISWGFKDRIGFIVEEDMGIQRNWRRKLGLIRSQRPVTLAVYANRLSVVAVSCIPLSNGLQRNLDILVHQILIGRSPKLLYFVTIRLPWL